MGELTKFMNEISVKYSDYWYENEVANPKMSIIVAAYNVEDYIESDLCYDSIRKEDKDFLESLTEEDIKRIADKVRDDDGISEEINNSINYYIWHYKKEQ